MLSEYKILSRLLFCLLFSLGVHAGVVLFEWSSSPVADNSALNSMEVSLVATQTVEEGAVAAIAVAEPVVKTAPVRPAVTIPAPDLNRSPANTRARQKLPVPEPASSAVNSQQAAARPVVTKAEPASHGRPDKPAAKANQSLSAQPPPAKVQSIVKPSRQPAAFPSVDLACKTIRQRENPKSSPAGAASTRIVSAVPAGPQRTAETPPPSAAPAAAMTSAEPRYRSNPLPEYPYLARQRHWEGLVWLLVSVSAEGRVDDLQVAETSGYGVLDKSAMKTVRRWRFSPAKKAGLPVESMVRIPVRFRLEE